MPWSFFCRPKIAVVSESGVGERAALPFPREFAETVADIQKDAPLNNDPQKCVFVTASGTIVINAVADKK